MGKRSSLLVVLSSSDEELNAEARLPARLLRSRSNLGTSKRSSSSSSKSKTASRPSRPRAQKKARFSDSFLGASKERDRYSEFESLYEDFSEDFAGFKVSSGFRSPEGVKSWVDKYAPRTLEDLAVNKKKVEEVKLWFEKRMKATEELHNQVLLITGPAGVGKSATIKVMASQFGATVREWSTPVPTIWREYVYNSNSGIKYVSKLDEFENFVERAAKYGLLSSSINVSTSVVLLIDDLPVTTGRAAYHKLLRSLKLLIKSARVPTVILISDYGRADSVDSSIHHLEDLSLSLEEDGVCKVVFNPITVKSVKKTLSRICNQEQCKVIPEQIDLIANASGGDIRHAITSLQYFCVNPLSLMCKSSVKYSPDYLDGEVDNPNALVAHSLSFGRDEMLSLFHALGKFLHNKREMENTVAYRENTFPLKEGFTRLPLKMDAPEQILCQAHGHARPVSEFLHENILDFLGEEAIEDAWAIATYLGDADCLLSSHVGRSHEAENILQSAAASVAVRGVLFGNAHPAPSRWHAIRRPYMWTVERTARLNKYRMEKHRVTMDYRPMLKWLGGTLPLCNASADGEFDSMSLTDQESEGDDIEEWDSDL